MEASEEDFFVQQLNRALRVVQQLETQIRRLNDELRSLEERSVLEEVRSLGLLSTDAEESASTPICVITPIIQTDPLVTRIDQLMSESIRHLRVLRLDPTVSGEKTDQIVRQLIASMSSLKKSHITVVVLKWAYMIPPLEERHTVVIGTRYLRDPRERLKTLEQRLQSYGLNILRDDGIYGGGRLCHDIIAGLRHQTDVTVAEVTMSCSVVENRKYLEEVLRTVSEL